MWRPPWIYCAPFVMGACAGVIMHSVDQSDVVIFAAVFGGFLIGEVLILIEFAAQQRTTLARVEIYLSEIATYTRAQSGISNEALGRHLEEVAVELRFPGEENAERREAELERLAKRREEERRELRRLEKGLL